MIALVNFERKYRRAFEYYTEKHFLNVTNLELNGVTERPTLRGWLVIDEKHFRSTRTILLLS